MKSLSTRIPSSLGEVADMKVPGDAENNAGEAP
jgi:hypothetical protein